MKIEIKGCKKIVVGFVFFAKRYQYLCGCPKDGKKNKSGGKFLKMGREKNFSRERKNLGALYNRK
ncbi:MAG: hypothetical protein IKK40_04040 [Bacteroidales bacterium]|nr:hypothetical protein [Bacteroidales bacterium]